LISAADSVPEERLDIEKLLNNEAFPKLKFWESNLKFRGKSGLLAVFSKILSQNRALLAHS
jgi:hypothetical protein